MKYFLGGIRIYSSFFIFLLLFFLGSRRVLADEPLVIVLDPGHSGENLGAEYNGYTEKELNMVVALAMYEELKQYDNVEVYLTHTEDVDMSLKERAEFAAGLNADFLFCLHLEAMGLYSRGVKTKLKEDGSADYYGIIRESRELGLACALIEHCHLDHKNDEGYYDTEEKLKAMGRADAQSVAKYFGLPSKALGIDYSDYPREDVPVPAYVMAPDSTDPDVCYIEEASCDAATGKVEIALTAQDYDSPMLYYNYSTDGGLTWTELFPWEEGKDTQNVILQIPSGQVMPAVVFRAYNLFDRYTQSNSITYPTFRYGEDLPDKPNKTPVYLEDEEILKADSGQVRTTFAKTKEEEPKEQEFSFLLFLEIIFISAITAKIITFSRKKRRRRK